MEREIGLPLFLGVITTISVIVGIVVVVALSGFLVQSFTLLFVIPIGGVIAGAGCALGVFLGLLWLNRKPAPIHMKLAAALAIIGFIGTYMALYLTTYVGPDRTLNHSFEGIPLSDFMSFFDYLQMDISNRASTFFLNVGHAHIPIGLDKGGFNLGPLNWASFIAEPIGYIAGGLLLAPEIIGDRRYCEACQVYMKPKPLFRAPVDEVGEKIDLLNTAIAKSGTDLQNLVNTELKAKKVKNAPFFQFALEYCPKCFDGVLHVKAMRKGRDGPEEVEESRQTIRLDRAIIHDYLS
jgi:hypothetical protein